MQVEAERLPTWIKQAHFDNKTLALCDMELLSCNDCKNNIIQKYGRYCVLWYDDDSLSLDEQRSCDHKNAYMFRSVHVCSVIIRTSDLQTAEDTFYDAECKLIQGELNEEYDF